MSETVEPHRIEWRISPGEFPTARIVCDGDEGATCRMWCDKNEYDCEEGHCDHPRSDKGTCGLVPWFQSSADIQECYDGPEDTPVRDGAIVIRFESVDEPVWQYVGASS